MKSSPRNAARITRPPSKKAPARRSPIKRPTRATDCCGKSSPAPECESHWFRTILFAVYVAAIIGTSLGYAAEYKTTGNPMAGRAALLRASRFSGGRLSVRAYVQGAAKAAGVDPRVAEWIVAHESQHYPQATGDGGESRGLWQINRIYHPEVSDQCAYDVRCSTDWALERIMDGYIDEWSTWKYRKVWFPDSPLGAPISPSAAR